MKLKLSTFASNWIGWLTATIALALFLFHPTVLAQRTSDRQLVSLPVGLSRNQSIRFTLFHSSGEPVRAHVVLFDAAGETVAESGEVTILGGRFHSFDFKPEDIHQMGEEGTGRRELRSSCFVRVTGPFSNVDGLAPSVEIIEDGLSTTLMVGETRPRPQDNDPGPSFDLTRDYLVGIVPDETLRVNLLNPSVNGDNDVDHRIECSVGLLESDGSVRFLVDSIPIPPGEFRSIDFKSADLPVARDAITGRAQVHVRVRHRFFSLIDRSQLSPSSVEIVNREGRTAVFYPGFTGGVRVASADLD